MYTVDQMCAPTFAHSWFEAVAVVQAVALALGSLSTVPAAEDLLLEEDGTVRFGFASEASAAPVAALAALLLQLLEGTSAPAELSRLAGDFAGLRAGDSSIARFTEALAIYERPDRRGVIRGVVGRLVANRLAEESDRATQRLRERIAGAPHVDQDVRASLLPARTAKLDLRRRVPASIEALRQRLTATSRHHVVAGGTMVCAALVVVVGLSFVHSPRSVAPLPPAVAPSASATVPTPSELAGPEPPAAAREPRAPASARPVAGGATPRRRVVSPPPLLTATVTTETVREIPESQTTLSTAWAMTGDTRAALATAPLLDRAARRPSAPILTVALDAPASAIKGTTAPRVIAEASPRAAAAGGGDPLDPVYSASESRVTPAQLVRSQLPKQPFAGAGTSYFDLIVDEAGDVQFVRLISPRNRYQDRMLVAAAKAWKFKPAVLDGKPVKYRLRMPVIASEPD